MAEVEREMIGDRIVGVAIRGEYDLADEARTDLAVDFVVGLEIPNVLIDLSRCEFIDATGMRMLLRAQERVHRSGARIAIAGPPPQVRRVFELTGISERLALHDGRERALEALRTPPTQPALGRRLG